MGTQTSTAEQRSTGSVSFGTVPMGTLGFAFIRDPLEPFKTKLLTIPKWVHLRSQSRLELFSEVSCLKGWNGSK